MTGSDDERYVVHPYWSLALVAAVCLVPSVLALTLRPHDGVTRAVTVAAVLVTLLTAVLLRLGSLALRRSGTPPGGSFTSIVPGIVYFTVADAVGRSHGSATRVAVAAVAAAASGVLVGVLLTQRRSGAGARRSPVARHARPRT